MASDTDIDVGVMLELFSFRTSQGGDRINTAPFISLSNSEPATCSHKHKELSYEEMVLAAKLFMPQILYHFIECTRGGVLQLALP